MKSTNTNGSAHSKASSVAKRTSSSKMSSNNNSRTLAKRNGNKHAKPLQASNKQPTESSAISFGKYGSTSFSGPDADKKISQLGNNLGKWGIILLASGTLAWIASERSKSKNKIAEGTAQTAEHAKQEETTTVELGKREEKKTEELAKRGQNTTDQLKQRSHNATEEAIEKRERIHEQDQRWKEEEEKARKLAKQTAVSCVKNGKTWAEVQAANNPFPSSALPLVLQKWVEAAPEAARPAYLLSGLSAFGCVCFSKVTSSYRGKLQRPCLQVCIEGVSGSGKGGIKDSYDKYFEHVISRDLNNQKIGKAVQTIGPDITVSSLFSILEHGNGMPLYLMAPEIASLITRLSDNKSGLTPDSFRLGYDGDQISHQRASKDFPGGSFPLWLGCTVTGTQKDVNRFLKKINLGAGNESRFCWSFLPNLPYGEELKFPNDDEMKQIQDTIDEWVKRYAFCEENGVQPDTHVDLEYVSDCISEWQENAEKQACTMGRPGLSPIIHRSATNAFRAAITLHMMFDCPTPNDVEKRNSVIRTAQYVAEYCKARADKKFGAALDQEFIMCSNSEIMDNGIGILSVDAKNIPDDVALRMLQMYSMGSVGYGQVATVFYSGYGLANKKQRDRIIRCIERRLKGMAVQHGFPGDANGIMSVKRLLCGQDEELC